MQHTVKPQVTIITFGFLHGPPPEGAHVVLDLRTHFRDPHATLRSLTAEHDQVRTIVLGTPGLRALLRATVAAARAYLRGPVAEPLVVAVGCAGGRHRAATAGIELERRLSRRGILPRLLRRPPVAVTLTHRDIEQPVIDR